jgi:hypothetical protein
MEEMLEKTSLVICNLLDLATDFATKGHEN